MVVHWIIDINNCNHYKCVSIIGPTWTHFLSNPKFLPNCWFFLLGVQMIANPAVVQAVVQEIANLHAQQNADQIV